MIREQLNAGAMGVAYLAQHPRLPRLDVVKVINPHLTSSEDYRHRFLREADLIARLEHPHVVTIHDRGEDDGLLYIAMQYVPDGDLRKLLNREGQLPLDTALTIGEQLASALDAAHEQGVVHRDVKPENVLMVRADLDDPYAVLADFGISRTQTSTALTADGSVLATPGYAAPEQVEGGPLDGATDQYALACLVFEMLSGHVPFPRDTVTAALIAHVTEPPPLLSTVAPGSPPALDEVLVHALAKEPQDRFPSCRAFLAAARTAVALPQLPQRAGADDRATVASPPVGPVATDPPRPAARSKHWTRSRWLIAAALVLIVAGGTTAAVMLSDSSSTSSSTTGIPGASTTVIQPSTTRGGTLKLAYQIPCTFDPQVVSISECVALQELVNRHLLTYAPKPGRRNWSRISPKQFPRRQMNAPGPIA